jgi:hypothetical protein
VKEDIIITEVFQDKKIFFDKKGNELYLNATKTAKEFGKRLDKWKESPQTIEYIEALNRSPKLGKRTDWVIVRQGGIAEEQGTWIHKKLIILFARWLSADFSVWCDLVIERILSTGSYSLKKTPQTSLEVVENGIKLLTKLRDLNPLEQIELDTFHKNKNGESLLEQFGKSFKNSYFLPTEIGKMLGQSGAEINLILEKKGFQFRDEKGVWKPTSSGKEFCLEIGNAYNQLKWRIETVLK